MDRERIISAADIIAKPHLTEEEVAEALVECGFSESEAFRLQLLLPIAFSRPILEMLGVSEFSPTISLPLANGGWLDARLTDQPEYVSALSLAREHVKRSLIERRVFEAIVTSSAHIDAVNRALDESVDIKGSTSAAAAVSLDAIRHVILPAEAERKADLPAGSSRRGDEDREEETRYSARTKTREGGIMIGEFKSFIMRGNVLDLAVAVIIGAAFATIVASLTDDLIMPLIGAVFGNMDFSNRFLLLGDLPAGYDGPMTYVALKAAGVPMLGWGQFLSVLVNFLILAFAIFLLVKAATRATARKDAVEEEAAPAEEILLLREIRDELKARR